MSNFETLAAPYLPKDAYDVESAYPFVARYKTPNSYRKPEGYIVSIRFMAFEFAKALAVALGDGWNAALWSEQEYATSEFARLEKGNLAISIRVQGYGVNAYSKIELTGYYTHPTTRVSSQSVEIKVSAAKDVATIAKDVARRILPQVQEKAGYVEKVESAKIESAAIVQKKATQLAKRYPNLRINADRDSTRINIETKYGAGMHLDSYAYLSGEKWRLTSQSGNGLSLDNLDSKYGRAFLALCNAN